MRQKADFERVRSHGQTWRHPLFVLSVCRNEGAVTRVGIVAGKKIGKAVTRNRVRRLLREAARLLYGRLAPGWDVVLIARPAAVGVKMPPVYAALADLARRAGVLRPAGESTNEGAGG